MKLGLANVFLSQGYLSLAEGKTELALELYQEALPIYRVEQDPMGQAYTISEIIRCLYRINVLDSKQLHQLALEALTQADKSGLESVAQYVLGSLYEACDNDEHKLKGFFESLGE